MGILFDCGQKRELKEGKVSRMEIYQQVEILVLQGEVNAVISQSIFNPDINPRISALRNLANITDTTLFIEENEFELEILTKEIFVKTKYLINVKIPLNITLGQLANIFAKYFSYLDVRENLVQIQFTDHFLANQPQIAYEDYAQLLLSRIFKYLDSRTRKHLTSIKILCKDEEKSNSMMLIWDKVQASQTPQWAYQEKPEIPTFEDKSEVDVQLKPEPEITLSQQSYCNITITEPYEPRPNEQPTFKQPAFSDVQFTESDSQSLNIRPSPRCEIPPLGTTEEEQEQQ